MKAGMISLLGRSGALRVYRDLRARVHDHRLKTVITESCGRLAPSEELLCALLVVGRHFDQTKPDAMMTCRMGYARAFEALGIPYILCDWRKLPETVREFPRSFAMVFGSDVAEMSVAVRRALAGIPNAVWVNPWFSDERSFFAGHGLHAPTWIWTDKHRGAILELNPKFGFTATVTSGLSFFSEWDAAGLKMQSLPLACDTSLYQPLNTIDPEFDSVQMAFVGGYWESKGRALDRYLRPFEQQLTIYGYSPWPYSGYRGLLDRSREPMLYRQALVCPVINEPTVALLRGQINERIFKVFGSGGVAVVDAVPAYRDLFTEDELAIPNDEFEFGVRVKSLLADPEARKSSATRGRAAVLSRHTYVHRVRQVMVGLRLEGSEP